MLDNPFGRMTYWAGLSVDRLDNDLTFNLSSEFKAKLYSIDVLALCTTIDMVTTRTYPSKFSRNDFILSIGTLRFYLVCMIVNPCYPT